MPLWLLALLAAGVVGVGYSAFGGDAPAPPARSPSGKSWPPGITTVHVQHAVAIALEVEDHPASLRAFASVLEGYDGASVASLNARAAYLDRASLGIATYAEAGGVVSHFGTGMVSR